MKSHNFYHQQGSGYVSNEPITDVDVFDVVKDLKFRVPHFEDIMKSFDSTYLEDVWNIAPYIKEDGLGKQLFIKKINQLKNITEKKTRTTSKTIPSSLRNVIKLFSFKILMSFFAKN